MKPHDETTATPLKPILLNYGGAEKALNEMNDEELKTAGQSILRRVKEKAFSKGLPIYYAVKGQLVAEYPDGKIIPVNQ